LVGIDNAQTGKFRMATLTVLKPTYAGNTLSFANADAGGDRFINNGRTFVFIKNDDAGSITVTIDATSDAGLSYVDPTKVVAAGSIAVFGPFVPRQFSDLDGYINVTYTAATNIKVLAIGM